MAKRRLRASHGDSPSRLGSHLLSAGCLVLAVLAPGSSAASGNHYENLLIEGKAALSRQEFAHAAQSLRLACFGLLAEPDRLADCLVYLAAAQAEAGEEEAFQESFDRLLEVEQRFGTYSRLALTGELQLTLEDAARRWVSPEKLASVRAFAALAEPEPEVPADETPAANPGTEPETPAEPPAAGEPQPAELATQLEEARAKLGRASNAQELNEVYTAARGIADAHPEASEAQHLVAEIAYRTSRWREVIGYFERGGEIDPDRPALSFYLAVALYETGERERAARVLSSCVDRLKDTAFVRSYAQKIFAEGG